MEIIKSELEKLIEEGLTTHELADKFCCSQTGIRYWLRKYGLNTQHTSLNKVCKVCGSALRGKQTSFCSKKCKQSKYSHNPNNYLVQKSRSFIRKEELIRLKGGCCQICGYKKNYAALVFHHLDPQNKTFNIDSRKISNTNWNSLLLEVEKCQLLCQNCHHELHNPSLTI